jgi:glucose-1-phosphate thymidylyltransferase
MKGIILAGGNGTRLYPATKAISKQLMPVYDKPMVYYPISTMILAGIRDLLLISTPRDLPMFKYLLGDGSQWGINFTYAEQDQPRGLADAFRVGKKFIGDSNVAMILGDNIYYGQGLGEMVRSAATKKTGATVFGYRVSDPQRYGVISYNKKKEPIDIIEKPKTPASNWVITGLYFYDNGVVDVAASLKPSQRGELEITDVNRHYLNEKKLDVMQLGRGYAWLDTGTHESLDNAAEFVRIVEQRQGLKIGCPEEIALAMGYINNEQVLKAAAEMGKTSYGEYLRRLAETEK